jgi:hypothetical protein
MGGIQPEHERSAGPVRANPAEQVGPADLVRDRQGSAPIEDAHAQQNDVSAPMGGIQPEHERSAGPVRANPAEQVGAARQRTDHRWRTRRRWVGGVNAMGRGGDPGVPGVRQGGGTGDPGSGERWRQRGTIGAPRQEGAQDPAGQGAAPVTRQAREEGLDLLLQQPFRGRAGHSILRVSRSFHDHDTDGSARAFGGTETVDNLPANPPPFNPVWEKGELGRPEAHHERRNAGAAQTPARERD